VSRRRARIHSTELKEAAWVLRTNECRSPVVGTPVVKRTINLGSRRPAIRAYQGEEGLPVSDRGLAQKDAS
jgi:hypothetical protein